MALIPLLQVSGSHGSFSCSSRLLSLTKGIYCYTKFIGKFCACQIDIHYFWVLPKISMTLGIKNTLFLCTYPVSSNLALTRALRYADAVFLLTPSESESISMLNATFENRKSIRFLCLKVGTTSSVTSFSYFIDSFVTSSSACEVLFACRITPLRIYFTHSSHLPSYVTSRNRL